MPKKILLVHKTGLAKEQAIERKLSTLDSSLIVISKEFNELAKQDVLDIDIIVTLGGDGTFVKAANLIEDALLMGVNTAPDTSEGALTSVLYADLPTFLPRIIKGEYSLHQRQRAKVTRNGKILEEHAINEVYVGTLSQFHSSRYTLSFKGHAEEHRSSGVIIATGTGSPAWFRSAGGDVFNPAEEKLAFIVREPYYGKRVFKPTLLRGDITPKEVLKIESKRESGGIISINDAIYPFNCGDVVEISLSPKPLNVIVFD